MLHLFFPESKHSFRFELGVHTLRLVLEGHHFFLNLVSDEFSSHEVISSDVASMPQSFVQVDGIAKVDEHFFTPLKPVRKKDRILVASSINKH